MLIVIVFIILIIILLSNREENFIDDYYSFDWTSPNLINDVNYEKVALTRGVCEKDKCTYSMSCDYTNDTSHPKCFSGYDLPGNGDLSHKKENRIYDHNHSI